MPVSTYIWMGKVPISNLHVYEHKSCCINEIKNSYSTCIVQCYNIGTCVHRALPNKIINDLILQDVCFKVLLVCLFYNLFQLTILSFFANMNWICLNYSICKRQQQSLTNAMSLKRNCRLHTGSVWLMLTTSPIVPASMISFTFFTHGVYLSTWHTDSITLFSLHVATISRQSSSVTYQTVERNVYF